VQTSGSYLFLCLGVLAFTSETSSDNALAKVSKSRVSGFESNFNYSNKTYRNTLILFVYLFVVKRDSSTTKPKRLGSGLALVGDKLPSKILQAN
jgi:hypothetical protein